MIQPWCDYSLLVCTYNRATDLEEVLQTAVAQRRRRQLTFEILVVDNNSSDGTAAVANRFAQAHPGVVRYLFEPRQGKSNALNTGLAAARGRRYAIIDDDFVLPPEYLSRVDDAFARHPSAAFVSGKVLPAWRGEPPRWLTPEHWSPLAIADYGDREFRADSANPICLLACVFDTTAVRAAGGYDGRLSVAGTRIGGTEDLDLLRRIWATGGYGVYSPDVLLVHKVGDTRLTRSYHRRWHRGHGASRAMMRDPEVERSGRRLLDVPGHVYRDVLAGALSAAAGRLRGDVARAYAASNRAWFALGFIEQRLDDLLHAVRHRQPPAHREAGT